MTLHQSVFIANLHEAIRVRALATLASINLGDQLLHLKHRMLNFRY